MDSPSRLSHAPAMHAPSVPKDVCCHKRFHSPSARLLGSPPPPLRALRSPACARSPGAALTPGTAATSGDGPVVLVSIAHWLGVLWFLSWLEPFLLPALLWKVARPRAVAGPRPESPRAGAPPGSRATHSGGLIALFPVPAVMNHIFRVNEISSLP